MSANAAYHELVDALEAAGLRVAVRDGDITPPVVYIEIGTTDTAGVPFVGGTVVVFYVHYIPVRGVDNLEGLTSAIDAINAALIPIAWANITGTRTNVTVKNDSWPCHRFDVSLAGVTADALKGA